MKNVIHWKENIDSAALKKHWYTSWLYQDISSLNNLMSVFSICTCQSNIHMDGRTQDFPAEVCPKHHTASASLHLVHPGAMCSPGKQCTRTRPSTRCKRKHDSLDQATFFHCSVVQFWCSRAHCWRFWRWTGQHGHPDWSAAMQPHTQQSAMHCVFWHLSIRTSFNFLSYSSSFVISDHTGQPSLLLCISEPWTLMTLSPVHHCSFLPWTTFDRYWPLQTRNTPQELQFWRCSDPVWPLSNSLNTLTLKKKYSLAA